MGKRIKRKCRTKLNAFMEEFSDIAYPGFLKVAFDDVGLEHLQKIHNNWEKVRELLTVHYCGLAPYEHMDLKEDDKNVLGKLYSYEM